MSHAALVNDVLFSLMVLLTLLLVMFIYAVIRMPPELADSPEPPMLTPPAPAAPPALPSGDHRGPPHSQASPATPVTRPGTPLPQHP